MAASLGSRRGGSGNRHLERDKLIALLAESQTSRRGVDLPAKKVSTPTAAAPTTSASANPSRKRLASADAGSSAKHQVKRAKKKKSANRSDATNLPRNSSAELPVVVQRDSQEKSRFEIGALKDRLEAGRFRYLNELLYTVPSQTALQLFQSDPTSFSVYHKGYKRQTEKWPSSPLNKVIAYVKQKASKLVIADMGCGDATLAASVPNQVFSFDLFAVNERVTVADIAHVPLKDKQVDIVIFCLSLMGTNFVDFLLEANRILKSGGHMKVMEIVSRFEGKLRPFTKLVERLGFAQRKVDKSNSHFVDIEFQKVRDYTALASKPEFRLQPCLYKKR